MHFLNEYAYGLWGAAIFNILMFGSFVYMVFRPRTKRDWRTMGVFTSFLVALFAEMFGFPLTIYLLTSLLGNRYPVLDPFTHLNGHLWVAMAGGSEWVYAILHPLSNLLIFVGLAVIAVGWKGIHRASGELVTAGIYNHVRHPQYTGFIIIIIGFLLQWPTIITLVMAPVLIITYHRLARREEAVMIEEFPGEYQQYKERVPAFIPRFRMNYHES